MTAPVQIPVEGALSRVHPKRPKASHSPNLDMVRLIRAGLDRRDACIHRLSKPRVAVKHGIGMGGRVGRCNHSIRRGVIRMVKYASPKVTIGNLPDVGAARALAHAARGPGHRIGRTGTTIGAADTIDAGAQIAGLTPWPSLVAAG